MRLDNRLMAVGLMAAIFVSGAITGVFVTRATQPERPTFDRRWDGPRSEERSGDRSVERPDRSGERDRSHRGGSPRDPRAIMSSRAVDHLARRLELTPEQRDSVDAILERQRERAGAVFADIGPRLRTVLDSTNTQIREILDPGQQTEFDAIIQEDRGVLGRRFTPPDSSGGAQR